MKKVPVKGSGPQGFATVSDQDYSKVKNHEWRVNFNGKKHYIRTRINGKYVNIGRIVKGLDSNDNVLVRYKDGNTYNNTRANLIIAD